MPDITTLLTFFITSLILAISPGPDIIFVLTQSALYGVRAGFITICGLMTGVSFHTAAVAFGIATIFQKSDFAFTILKCIGACYLLYLAWLSFKAGANLYNTEFKKDSINCNFWQSYRRGIFMSTTNPKVSLFFLAFLPQFCNPKGENLAIQILLLGFLFITAASIVFSFAAILGEKMAAKLNQSIKGQILIQRLSGIIFICLTLALFIQ